MLRGKILNILTNIIISIFVIIILIFLIRIFIADRFYIPSHSMEPTVIRGDYVMINKLIFGARIYKNLDFIEGGELKTCRVKGLRKIKHNDLLVYNYPFAEKDKGINLSLQLVYLKRCVGLPGDTISIRNGMFYNSSATEPVGYLPAQEALSRTDSISLPPEVVRALRRGVNNSRWSILNLGPVYVPRAGGSISLDSMNYRIYTAPIEYETKGKLRLRDGKLFLDKEQIDKYTFINNYYFTAGDNLMNSRDSRYWGFVPEEYIMGVATRILYSYDKETKTFKWNRLFKKLK